MAGRFFWQGSDSGQIFGHVPDQTAKRGEKLGARFGQSAALGHQDHGQGRACGGGHADHVMLEPA